MSPSFSEAERERIRGILLETGRELFPSLGLKKTSLEDLTRPARIHKTSFYSFFGSKEELYLELLLLEGPGVRERVNKVLGSADDPREALARFLRAVVDELEANPLVRRLVTHPEELEMVASRVRPEDLEAKAGALLPMRRFVEEGQMDGRIAGYDPEAIVGVLRAVTMLTLHSKDIGEGIYPQVMDLMVSLVADGLTRADSLGDGATGKDTEGAQE